jgi:ATP-dependent DNA ligase
VHPAHLVAFDLLLSYRGDPLIGRPLSHRRSRLEAFAERFFGGSTFHHLATPRPTGSWPSSGCAGRTSGWTG